MSLCKQFPLGRVGGFHFCFSILKNVGVNVLAVFLCVISE